MLYLILAETALERIPEKIARHPAVAKDAQKRRKDASQILLDSSRHFAAMRGMDDETRRGRPDIAHFCLSLAQDCVLNKKGMLKFFIHTRNDEVISVAPDARLPRAFNRFCGLVEDLFEKKEIVLPDGKVLLKMEGKNLKQLLSELPEKAEVFALDAGGELKKRKELEELFSQKGDVVLVVGGFPHGNFADSSKALERVKRISVADSELCAWTVVSILISSFEAGQGF